ncbi:MAG: hypothetical protein U9Q34_00515, partial [Elusimicrobiota bacterium]|nr:hypothetical protein [Elusimicrobiota bacterium]
MEKLDQGLMKFAKLISKKKMGEIKTEIAFMPTVLMLCCLPGKALGKKVTRWEKSINNFTLTIIQS